MSSHQYSSERLQQQHSIRTKIREYRSPESYMGAIVLCEETGDAWQIVNFGSVAFWGGGVLYGAVAATSSGVIDRPGLHFELILHTSGDGDTTREGETVLLPSANIFQLPPPSNETLCDKLRNLGVPEEQCDAVETFLDRHQAARMKRVNRETFTGVVFEFEANNQTYVVKLGPNSGQEGAALQREADYLVTAREKGLLQPIKPILMGAGTLDEGEQAYVVTRLAHHNTRFVSPERYLEYYERLVPQFMKDHPGTNDEDVVRMFNISLEHVIMSPHRFDPEFQDNVSQIVAPTEKIIEFLRVARGDVTEDLIELLPLYNQVIKRIKQEHGITSNVLANIDCSPDNEFGADERFGEIRVSGDLGHVMVTASEMSLGSMAIEDIPMQEKAYAFFTREIAKREEIQFSYDPKNLGQRIADAGFAWTYRKATHRARNGSVDANLLEKVAYFRRLVLQ